MLHRSACITGILLAAWLGGCNDGTPPPGTAGDATRGQVDLIIEGDHVVTMDAGRRIIEDGAVAIDEGVILAVAPAAEIASAYTAAETLPGDGRVVMPGLVNGHSHAAMTLLRGVADALALMEWLND